MRCGHRKFVTPLLAILILANPVLAGRPGERSRQWAKNAKTDGSVQNAVELRTPDAAAPVQQVVGKQPGSRKIDPNRSLFVPPLLGTENAKPLNGQRHSSSSRQRSRGLLGELFGNQSQSNNQRVNSQRTTTPRAANQRTTARNSTNPSVATPQANAPRAIDWEGIPYHQARTGNHAATAPIRDPQPGETRIARPTSPPRLADAPKSILAPRDLPKPPALEPAPALTSRRPASMASARITRQPSTSIAAGSSSRRAGRENVPSLDASEVAAARTDQFGYDELVPKVSRKRIKVDVAAKETVASAESTRREKTEPKPQATPAADVATRNVTPTTEATPEVKAEPAPEPTPAPAPQQLAASEPEATPATMQPAPASAPKTTSEVAQAPVNNTPPLPTPVTSSSKAVTAQPPQVVNQFPQTPLTDNFTASQPGVPSSFASTPLPPPVPSPSAPTQSLPMPTAPNFNQHAAAHHTGPAPNAFSSSYQPAASTPTIPSPVVGSGVQAPEARVAATPYPNDPYLTPTQRSAGAPPLPTPAATQPYNPATSNLGYRPAQPPTTQPAQPPATQPAQPPATQPTPSNLVTTPSPRTSTPKAFAPTPNPPLREDFVASSSDSNRADPMASLEAGKTAVASELPGLRVLTHGPASIVIRETHEFEIRAENRGAIDVSGLVIRTDVPNWAQVQGQNATRGSVDAETLGEGDRLIWKIDTLPAGTSERLLVQLQAVQPGKHGLDVEWTLLPQKSVATVEVQEPKLELLIEGPDNVVYGESQTYKVRVLNPGDGPAPNVVFTLSPNSPTPQSQRIGDIPSGKEAQFEVELTAQDLGNLKIHGLAAGDLNLNAQAEKTIRVDAAQLEAILSGPEVKYQNTDGLYAIELINHGTATSKQVVATMQLPEGMEYLGGLDEADHRAGRLTWNVETLPPGAKRLYEFKCKLNQPGEQVIQFHAKGSAAGEANVALDTRVESISDLVMTIQDPAAPAPVGTEVTYEILIKNRGSREARGVRAIAQFSHGIEPRRVQGHPGQVLTGQVLFDPIPAIPAGGEVRIKVMAEAEREGHHRFRTEIRSGETVLVAEEATHYMSKRTERVSRRSENTSLR